MKNSSEFHVLLIVNQLKYEICTSIWLNESFEVQKQ